MISVPSVNAIIENGQAQITGSASYEEADNIASTIRIGGLNLELEEISSKVVGAQLGEEAISTSLKAGAIGLAAVCLFMIFVYLLPGFASSIALVIYVGLILLLLNAFDITLTLPGIAGIILGIGMAVDANVIIFARVKEELSAGASVHSALRAGFHKAMSAILDGNITTLIAAAVLWLRGSGPVKGICTDIGSWYRRFDVYGACCNKTARIFFLCYRHPQSESIRQSKRREKTDRFSRKEKSVLCRFYRTLPERICCYGNQFRKGRGSAELQP